MNYDVIIIGGGATGTGTARDCAMRGFKTLLLERDDLATGASGRNHGLLHSGARYALTDAESARECVTENAILRNIATDCIEPLCGLFLSLDCDEPDYIFRMADACHNVGMQVEMISGEKACRMEPSANPRTIRALKVPDGAINPFRLCQQNAACATACGATVRTRMRVTELITENVSGKKRICGVEACTPHGRPERFYAPVVVCAGGIWTMGLLQSVGITLNMFAAKGTLLVFEHRINNVVLNRARKPSNGDIIVPGHTVSILGTTSGRVPYEQIDNVFPTQQEIDDLLREGKALAPCIESTRVVRAYCGVRPLVAADNDDGSGRNLTRGLVCIDHSKRDGVDGLITITGGKLMTYRLMAEKATDMVSEKLGKDTGCATATTPLTKEKPASYYFKPEPKKFVCECEGVTEDDVINALKDPSVTTLDDLRRRTRLGMGTCQGTLCIQRAAALMAKIRHIPDGGKQLARDFAAERWKGMQPVAWGDTLAQAEIMLERYGEKSATL